MPRIEHIGEVAILAPEGDINHHEMACLKNAISELLLGGQSRMVLDLSGVDHINYMTLGVLVERAGRLRHHRGDLRLAGVTPYLTKILRFTGVHHLLGLYPTVEEAVSSYAGTGLALTGTFADSRGSWVPQMH